MRLSFEDLNRVRHLAKRYVPCNIRRMLKEAELVERAIPAEDETSTSQSRDNVERSPASTPHSQKTQSDNILSTPARKSDFSEYDPSTPIPETSCGISILDPSVEYRTLIPAGNVYKYPILCVTAGYALWRMKNG